MAEWSIASVLKTEGSKGSKSSNLLASATVVEIQQKYFVKCVDNVAELCYNKHIAANDRVSCNKLIKNLLQDKTCGVEASMVMQWTVNPPPLARLVRSQDTPPLVVLFWKNSVFTWVLHSH